MKPITPELPPMQPMTPQPPPGPASTVAVAPPQPSGGGTRRLRQAVAVIASGGFMLIVAVLLLQLIARPGLRPSDLMATMEAQTELGIFNQKMGAARGEVLMTEDQYRAKIAEAERSGQTKAELAFQRDLAVVQGDKERVVGAYTTLYQRTNLIAQAGLQMEAQAQQFRQQLLASTNGGRAMVLAVEDSFCALGSEEACEAARKLRAGMILEAGDLSEGDLSAKIRELMAGVDDPATFVTHEDQRRNGTPAMSR